MMSMMTLPNKSVVVLTRMVGASLKAWVVFNIIPNVFFLICIEHSNKMKGTANLIIMK